LCPPGPTPERRIFDRINRPAVCQKVSTGPWNNKGIKAFQRLIVINTANVTNARPMIPKPINFKTLSAFILIIF
jgi:hypothetical protein